ncbi:CAP domain-containing protein [Lachnospiraceae bacterium 47-T17]
MKEKRAAIWKRILAVVLTVALLPVGGVQTTRAAETVSIQVEYRQGDTQTLANLVNVYRQGQIAAGAATSSAITLRYDYDLEAAAMQRAAEAALVCSSQRRPDGSSVLTAYGRSGVCVESVGTGTAEQVIGAWRSTAGDRANMINGSCQAIGVGHVVYNGHDYWVAAFSDTYNNAGQQPPGNGEKQITVSAVQQKRVDTGLASAVNLNVGDTVSFANAKASVQIEGHLPNGEFCPLAGGTPVGTSSNTSIVSVNGTTIKGEKPGKAVVTISCGGQTANVEVTVQQARLTIDTIPNQNYTGRAITPSITVRRGNTVLRLTTDYTVSYENNINVGRATVQVTGQGAYAGSTGTATFQIVTPTVANATITAIPDQVFTGNPVYPNITVYDNNRLLMQGVDYTVSYMNNTNMGMATVTITGMGVYTGTKTASFRITGPNLYSATIDAIPDQLYTGSNITPAVTVRLNNLILVPNVDYYASYSNNRNVGTATVTITGRGSYSGSRTTTFRIIDRNLSYATISNIPNQRYTGSEVRPDVTVTLGGTVLRQNVDYTLSYQNNRQPGTATVIATGTGSYKGSKSATFKIAQATLSSATVKVSNQTYNGEEKEPNVTVRLSGDVLEEGEDYEVTYKNNTKPGKATVTITGTGYYSGTKKATFVIKPKKQKLKSAKAKGRSASLAWTKDANAKGYEIYRSKKKSSGYSRIGTFSTNKTTACRNTNLAKGTYYYKVRSYILVGGKKYYGAFSNIKKVTIR